MSGAFVVRLAQEGFTWKGVTVTNPFSTPKHELLADLLGPLYRKRANTPCPCVQLAHPRFR